jgi:hypothetical protein
MLVSVIRVTISSRHQFCRHQTRETSLEIPEIASGCLLPSLCLASLEFSWLVQAARFLAVALVAKAPLPTGPLLASHPVTCNGDDPGLVAIAHCVRGLTQWALAGSHVGSRCRSGHVLPLSWRLIVCSPVCIHHLDSLGSILRQAFWSWLGSRGIICHAEMRIKILGSILYIRNCVQVFGFIPSGDSTAFVIEIVLVETETSVLASTSRSADQTASALWGSIILELEMSFGIFARLLNLLLFDRTVDDLVIAIAPMAYIIVAENLGWNDLLGSYKVIKIPLASMLVPHVLGGRCFRCIMGVAAISKIEVFELSRVWTVEALGSRGLSRGRLDWFVLVGFEEA